MTIGYSSQRKPRPAPPALVAVAAWVLPGAGYLLIHDVTRGLVVGITILALYLAGILLSGIRVIDVPGYDRAGGQVRLDPNGHRVESTSGDPRYRYYGWALTGRGFFGEIVNKPWYACQILTGPTCLLTSSFSLTAARNGVPSVHGRLHEIGTLYTAIAGLLNLLAIIDSSHRAAEMQGESK